jgi:phosphoglycolate phosphatase
VRHPPEPARLFHQFRFVQVVPRVERKPNPRLLLDICAREKALPSEAVYVGDSLTRDVSMAKEGEVYAVWARYGTRYDKALWNILVQITHWTDEDVKREEELRHRYDRIEPDYVIDKFAGLLDVVRLREQSA